MLSFGMLLKVLSSNEFEHVPVPSTRILELTDVKELAFACFVHTHARTYPYAYWRGRLNRFYHRYGSWWKGVRLCCHWYVFFAFSWSILNASHVWLGGGVRELLFPLLQRHVLRECVLDNGINDRCPYCRESEFICSSTWGRISSVGRSGHQFVIVSLTSFRPSDDIFTFIDVPAQLGKHFSDARYDWGNRTVPQKNAGGRVFDWPTGKVLGGSSAINFFVGYICQRAYALPSENNILSLRYGINHQSRTWTHGRSWETKVGIGRILGNRFRKLKGMYRFLLYAFLTLYKLCSFLRVVINNVY